MTRVLVGTLLFGLAGLLVLCNALMLLLSVPSVGGLLLATVAAVLPAIGYVFLVLRMDRFEHEPLTMVAVAFFWGALVATLLSFVVNSLGGAVFMAVFGDELGDYLTGGFIAPVVEETFKGIALVLLLVAFRREFDNVTDGILYGSLVGLGFAMTENILYFGRAVVEGGIVGLGLVFYLRVVLSGLAHAIFTGTFGAGLGYLRERRDAVGWLAAVASLGLAMLQHALWNLIPAGLLPILVGDSATGALLLLVIGFPLGALFFLGPGFVLLLALATRCARREAAIIRRELLPEVAAGVITPRELDVLASPFGRTGEELGILLRRGPGAWLEVRTFHQLATELAFSRHHAARGEFRDVQPRPEQDYQARLLALGRFQHLAA